MDKEINIFKQNLMKYKKMLNSDIIKDTSKDSKI